MKNLTQISLEYHISKAALTQRINKIPGFRNKYCQRKKNRLFIYNNGVKLISQPKHNSTAHKFHTRKGKNGNQLTKYNLSNQNKQLMSIVASQQNTIANMQKILGKYGSIVPKILSSLRNQYKMLKQHSKPKIQYQEYNPKTNKAIQAAAIDKDNLSKMRIKHIKDAKIIAYYRNMSWVDKLKNLF